MTDKKKNYEEPALDIIKVRRLNLLAGSEGATQDPDARQNDLFD